MRTGNPRFFQECMCTMWKSENIYASKTVVKHYVYSSTLSNTFILFVKFLQHKLLTSLFFQSVLKSVYLSKQKFDGFLSKKADLKSLAIFIKLNEIDQSRILRPSFKVRSKFYITVTIRWLNIYLWISVRWQGPAKSIRKYRQTAKVH